MKSDLRVEDHGSVFLVQPFSSIGLDWLRDNTQDGALWYSGALAVEPRYIVGLVEGARDAGLLVDAGGGESSFDEGSEP